MNLHVLGTVLRCASAQTVQSERVLVGGSFGVVVVFAARIQLAVDQIPVPTSLGFVPTERNAAPEVLHRKAVVEVDRCADL